jgi:hypothetical protein
MIYTQSDLRGRINAKIQGKIDMLVSDQDTMNEAVREVLTEVRLHSTRRKASLTPNLFSQQYEYACPSDLMGPAIIDVPAQAKRADGEFTLVPSEQFRRYPQVGDIAIEDFNGTRLLLINSAVEDATMRIVSTDSLTVGSGTWSAIGDATNIEVEYDDYVVGDGSISFDINGNGGASAGIDINGLDSIDLSDYIGHAASVFVHVRITDTTGVQFYQLRLGQNNSTYYYYQVSAQNDGTAFRNGWNLLRFDLVNQSVSGSPDATAVDYAAVYMLKDNSKANEVGYLVNDIVAKKGKYHSVMYYSKYGWQSSTGTYKENSTDASDLLNADTDEFDLVVKKGRVIAGVEVDLPENQVERLKKEYEDARQNYQMKNPSEDKMNVSTYHYY